MTKRCTPTSDGVCVAADKRTATARGVVVQVGTVTDAFRERVLKPHGFAKWCLYQALFTGVHNSPVSWFWVPPHVTIDVVAATLSQWAPLGDPPETRAPRRTRTYRRPPRDKEK